eukprot:CAMPEP_0197190010 /NCGR_PEP_ID=MMETSP1423-20130617/20823_1 /TAXON_ID=476441 /ORGANISM="Pseudo-nitzschia heimii, Strain UNC1101" /LENGTH=354 /DNA_ID=CAMNT_0042642287 /DNA_START=174 /DNA_END=1238 /DNA_ORIENTATION=-
MPNSNQHEMQDQIRERQEEQRLFQRFQNVATKRLEEISRKAESTNQVNTSGESNGFDINVGSSPTSELQMGEEEQRIMSQMAGMGLKEGILASVASFVVLRRGPKYIGRWVHRRFRDQQFTHSGSTGVFSRSNTSYQLSDPKKLNHSSNNNPFQNAAKARQNEFPRPRGFLSRSIWFVFDTVLSLMVGANVSMYLTDKEEIRKQIVELPLVSGRSLTADTLCDELVEELRQVRGEKNPTFERLEKISRERITEPTAASFFMEGIVLFCQNCERRRYFERSIREESGFGKSIPVKVPTPGVPRDCPRLVKGDNGIENVIDKDGIDDPFSGQFHQDTSWAKNDFSDDSSDDNDRGL